MLHKSKILKIVLPIVLLVSLKSVSYCQDTKNTANSKGPQPHEIVADTNKVFKGNAYALIVGINNYKAKNKFIKLHHSIDDANAFKNFLNSNAGGNVPDSNIRMLTEDSATFSDVIYDGLRWLKTKTDSGDRIYLYFSGHGLSYGGDSYFLFQNTESDIVPEKIQAQNTIALSTLNKNTIGPLVSKGAQVYLIVDACRSVFTDTLNSKFSEFADFNPDITSPDMKLGGVMFLSCNNGEVSTEYSRFKNKNINHSIFTYYLLNGLYGLTEDYNSPGFVTYEELKDFVQSNVKKFTGSKQIPKIDYNPMSSKVNPNPVMSLIDSKLLAKAEKEFNNEDGSNNLAVNNAPLNKGLEIPTLISEGTDSIYLAYLESIKKGILFGSNSATYFFKELELKSKDAFFVRDASNKLTALMLDSAQLILNSYLSSNEDYFKKNGSSRDRNIYSELLRGAFIFDTLYNLSEKYFPGDKDNYYFVQHAKFFKGSYTVHSSNNITYNKTACKLLMEAYEVDTTNSYILRNHAVALSIIGQNKDALNYINKVLEKFPRWVYAWNTKGNIYLDQKKYNMALDCFQRAIEINNKYPIPYLNIGYYYSDVKKDYKKAIEYYQKALEIDSTFTLSLTNQALSYWRLNQFEESKQCCFKALKIDSNDAYAWTRLAIIYASMKKNDSALYFYKRAINVDSSDGNSWNNLGNFYFDQKKYKEAEFAYKSGIERDSNNIDLWKNLGDIYAHTSIKKYDSALYFYNRAINVDSSDGNSWNNLGNFYFYQKKYKEAEFVYKSGIERDSNNIDLWKNLGDIYNSTNNFERSQFCFKKAISIDSKSVDAWLRLADFYAQQGMDSSLICDKVAISIDSNNANSWLYLGIHLCNHNQSDYNNGIKAYKRGLQSDSNHIELWNHLGDAYNSIIKYDSALICYLKALSIDSNNSESWKKTGDLFKSQNNYDSALICYIKRTKLFSTSDKEDMIIRGDYYSLYNIDSTVYFYKKATQFDSSTIDDWLRLANFFREIKYYDSSINYLKWIEDKISPKNNRDSFKLSVSWYNLGNDLRSGEDTSDKILDKRKFSYKSAIKYYPQHNEALINLSNLYLGNKQYDSCILMLNQAYLIDSNFVMLWYNYANFYDTYSNDQTNYISCMKRALLHINMYPVYSNMKESICKNLGYSYYLLTDFDSSKHYYKLGLQFLEENFGKDNIYDRDILNMLGYCNLKLNRKDSAGFYFKRYIEKYPQDDNAYDSYGEFLNAIEKYDESIKEYEKAIAINPNKMSSLEALKELYQRKGNIKKADEIILRLSKLKN